MVAKDISEVPRAATSVVVITIIRNQYAPVFTASDYTVSVSDTMRAGYVLTKLPASDDDSKVPLSANVSS